MDPYLLRGIHNPDACLVGRAGDDGMSSDGIQKGDFLIIEETQDLSNGTIVACLVGEELHARRYHFANNRIHLRPANRTYTEETFAPRDPNCHVIGRVISLMRRY